MHRTRTPGLAGKAMTNMFASTWCTRVPPINNTERFASNPLLYEETCMPRSSSSVNCKGAAIASS
eukprot:2037541-Prorocentrum_lima.AAC.1